MIISSVKRVPLPSADSLAAGALLHFGMHARVFGDTCEPGTDQSIDVTRPGQAGVHDRPLARRLLDLVRRHQGAERRGGSLVPLPAAPDFPRLIADDMGWGWHVDLVHGITAEQFVTSIVDHDVPGWNDNDPDLA